MNGLKNTSTKFYRSGFLFLSGLIVIAYGGLGFLYLQQGSQQQELTEQVTNLENILAKPLSSIEELSIQYEAITANLTPIGNIDAIERLIEIADKYDIDTTQGAGRFTVPPAVISSEKVGATTYRVLIYNGISVQGQKKDILDFISDIEQGLTYNNIVITSLSVTRTVSVATDEELIRRQELQMVQDAVHTMMADNDLYFIYNPVIAGEDKATNYMGDDPETNYIVEGFPDTSTPPVQKGYTGYTNISSGYLLYQHDRVDKDNRDQYTTVDYVDSLRTSYYYTCESNGTVHQWDGPDTSQAREYDEMGTDIIYLTISLNLKFYTLE